MVRAKFAREGKLSVPEAGLLTHEVIMKDLRRWASTNNVPFVNIIQALDMHRDFLVTWVHLIPAGNRIIASTFSEGILKHLCR